jgi:hypothetical protein
MKSNYTLEELLKAKIGQSTPPPTEADALWADMNARLDAFPIGNTPGAPPPTTPELPLPGQALVPPAPISPAIYLASIFVAGSLILGVLWWKNNPVSEVKAPPVRTETTGIPAENAPSGATTAAPAGANTHTTTPGDPETTTQNAAHGSEAGLHPTPTLPGAGSKHATEGKAVLSSSVSGSVSLPKATAPKSEITPAKQRKQPVNVLKKALPASGTITQLPVAQAGTENKPAAVTVAAASGQSTPASLAQNTPPAEPTLNTAGNTTAPNGNTAATALEAPFEGATAATQQAARWDALTLLPGWFTGALHSDQAPVLQQPLSRAPVSKLTSIYGENRRSFMVMIGSDLEKTPRQRANFVEVGMYANLGMGYQAPVNRRWALRCEGWYQQFATPQLNRVTNYSINTDADRIARADTLSVTRMAGMSLSLMAVRYLPADIKLLGGLNVGWYNRVLVETGYSENSVIGNVYSSRGTGFNYSYSAPPSWFQQVQPGLRLGVEKVFFEHWVLGLNLYKGMVNITKFNQGLNLSTNWLLYTGYRF